jgi:hypothetical protein
MTQRAESVSLGTVLHCPACGHEHRRKYVPAAALKAARAELGRFLEAMHWVMPNLNDTFAYAMADSERIYMDGESDDEDDAPTNTDMLVRVFRNYGFGGIVAYVAKMRGAEPIKPCRTVDYENAVLALKDWTYEPD